MRRDVTVTVADSHAGDIDEVAERLRRAGMQVDRVLAALGVITGSIDAGRLGALEALPGVAAVERQTGFQIAPPDADVQ
ncbi:MAG TPA: hypothetical protein VGV67_09490 [Solirubrobacteraceae bacterium]|nr:hypothetical protein [Solirubrobacteraceae bacterium]